MSILNKHPAPWRAEEKSGGSAIGVTDANGCYLGFVESRSDEVERLILAAPELLAALKESVEVGQYIDQDREAARMAKCEALIARIEGSNG